MESFPMALSSEADVHSSNSNTRIDGQHHSQTEDQDRLALLRRARAKLSLSNRGGLLPEPHLHPNQEYTAPSNGLFVGQDSGFHLPQENFPCNFPNNPADLLRRAREKLTFSNRVEVSSNGTTAELQPGSSSEHWQKREEAEIQKNSEADVSPLERLRLARARLRSCVNSLPGSAASEPPRRVEERDLEAKQSPDSHHPSPTHVQHSVPEQVQSLEQIQQYDSPEVVHHGDDMDIESESGSPWRQEENEIVDLCGTSAASTPVDRTPVDRTPVDRTPADRTPVVSISESHFDFGIDVRKTFLMQPEMFEVPFKSKRNIEECTNTMDMESSCTDSKLQDKWSQSKNEIDHEKHVSATNNPDIFIINERSSFMKDYSLSKKTSHSTNADHKFNVQPEGMEIGPDELQFEPEIQEMKSNNQKRISEHRRAPVDKAMNEKDFVFTSSQPPSASSEALPKDTSASKSISKFTLPSLASPPVPVPPPQFAVNSLPTPVPPPVNSLSSVPKPVPPPFVTFAALPTPVPSPLVTMAIAHSSVPRNVSGVPTPVPPPQINSSINADAASQLASFLSFSLSSILPTLDGKHSTVSTPVANNATKSCDKYSSTPTAAAASKSSRAAPIIPGTTSKSSRNSSVPLSSSKSSRGSPVPPSSSKSSRSSPIPPSSSSRSSRTSPAPPHVSRQSTKPSSTSGKPSKSSSTSTLESEKSASVAHDSTPASSVDLPFTQVQQPPLKEITMEHKPETRDSMQDSLFSLIPPPPPAGSVDLDEVEDVDFSFTRLPPPPLGSEGVLGDFSFTRMPPPFFNADSEQANHRPMPFTRFPPPRMQGPPRPQGPQVRPRGATWLQGRPSGPGPGQGPGQGQGRALLPTPVRPPSSSRPPLLPTPKPNFRSGRSRWGDYSPVEDIQPSSKPDAKPPSKFHSEQHRHGEEKGFKLSSRKPEKASTHHKHVEQADSDSDSSMGAYDGGMHDAGDYPSDDEMETDAHGVKCEADGMHALRIEKVESCAPALNLETRHGDRRFKERESHKSTDGSHAGIQLSQVPLIKIKLEVEEPDLPMDITDFTAVNIKPDPDALESLHTSIDLGVESRIVIKIEPNITPPKEIKEENSYLCTECGKRFNDKFNLEAHLYDHLQEFTGKHPYRCSKCPGRVFKDMKLHRHHHLMGLECDVCGEAFHAAISLAEHRMRVHMAKKAFSCSVCNKRYTTASDLAYHQKKRHSKPKKYKCKKCGKCFNHADYLAKHIQNHHSEDRSSGSREQLKEKEKDKEHLKQLATPKEDFATKDLSEEHIQSTHTETQDKKLSCKVCEQTFTLLEDLQAHEVSHGENPFKCEECDARFSLRQELKDHSRKHRTHKCVLCGYITSSSASLLKHMKNHHKDDVFECQNCDKWYPKEDELKLHEETEHTKCHDDNKTETVDSIKSNPEDS